MKKKKRIQALDIARGIAIILMLVGHSIPAESFVYKLIYSFHMPLFVLVSGYFFREDEKILDTIRKMFFKMILPMIFVYSITYLVLFMEKNSTVPLSLRLKFICLQLSGTEPWNIEILWFIPFLVGVRLLFTILFKIVKKKESIMSGLCAVLFVIGYQLGTHGHILPFGLDRTFTCLFLYDLGHLAKKKEFLPKILEKKWMLFGIAAVWLTCFFAISGRFDIAKRRYGIFGIGLLGAVCGTIIVIKLSAMLEKKLPTIRRFPSFLWKEFHGYIVIPSI